MREIWGKYHSHLGKTKKLIEVDAHKDHHNEMGISIKVDAHKDHPIG